MESTNTLYTATENTNEPFVASKKDMSKLLTDIGYPQHVYGYNYILYALELVSRDPQIMHHITKEIYPDIARHFGTTPERVEHSIRSSTRSAWAHGNEVLINQIFGYSVSTQKRVPTNAHLLAGLYQYLLCKKYKD